MTNLHEFRLIPSCGHMGDGTYSRGNVYRNLAEIDLIDRYVDPLRDELDHEAIRFSITPTRKAPGVTEEARLETLPHVMPITCGIGYSHATKIKPAYNISQIYYGEDVPKRLYLLIAETVAHWGSLYVHGHKSGGPQSGLRGLRIEPFMINGPSAAEYAARLDRLGRDIGRALSDYCRQVGAGAVFSLNKAPPKGARAI